MAQLQTKFIANGAITTPKLGTVTDGVTLDQSGSGSTLEVKAGGISNTQVNASAAIAYTKLATLGGSTNDVLIQSAGGFVTPSSILSTNLFLADGSVPATGAFNMNSNLINNVTDPVSAQDAATKNYVDNAINGLYWQPPVAAIATTSNVPLTGSTPLVIDGYTVQNGDRVILADQTTAAQNSVYVATTGGGTYTLNLASPSPVVGDAYLVLNGTVYADTGFVYSASTVFTQFASAPISYTAGTALTLTGHQFNVNVDNSTIDVSSNNLEVKAGGITNTQVSATAAIAFSKLAALTSAHILVGNGSNVATSVAMSGDINISNTGSTSIVATSNSTLTTLSALTTAASLSTVGTITSGTWNGTTIGIAYGGTGQTTAAAAFAALSPMTTAGDIIYENNTPAPARLPIGTSGQVLTVVGGLPAWSTTSTSVTTVGTFNSQTSSANGLVISGSNIYAQAPTSSNPGMITVPSSGSGLSLSTAALSVATDSATTKINGSNQVEALAPIEQNITLASGDITNQYVDLAHAVYGTSASSNSIALAVVGGPEQQKTVDYTVSLTGGSGGVTRVTFAGDLATGGNAALVSGDILMIQYSYLI